MSKVKSNYEIISDKTQNPVVSSEYIKHGTGWLDTVINQATSALNTKADKTYVDTQLATKANSSDVSAIQTTVQSKADSAAVSALAGRVTDVETEQDALSARMDTFTNLEDGSTTGDAELIDGRIGSDGTIYSNIGDSIRIQVSELKEDINVFSELKNIDKENIFVKSKSLSNKALNADGTLYNANNYTTSNFMPIIGGYPYRTNKYLQVVQYYTSGKELISALSGGTMNKATPVNAAYMRITAPSANVDGLIICSSIYEPNSLIITASGELENGIKQEAINLFDKSKTFKNYGLDSSGLYSNAGNYVASKRIPVDKLKKYKNNTRIQQFAQYKEDLTFISASAVNSNSEITLDSECAYVVIVVPTDNSDTFMFCESEKFPNTYVDGSIKVVSKDSLPDIAKSEYSKMWSGKSLCTIGDSLTNTKTWQSTVLDMCGFTSYDATGAIGATIAKTNPNSILQAVQNMDTSEQYDFITFWGGTNDWGAQTEFGDFETEVFAENPSETNFYGACVNCIRFLLQNFPGARLIVITPPPRSGYISTSQKANTVKRYGDALKKVAQWYSIPVLDMMEVCGINNYTFSQYMYLQGSDPNNQYYLHFTAEGGKKIGRMISNFINNC